MVVAIVVLWAGLGSGPGLAPLGSENQSSSGCWTQPLQLTLAESAQIGRVVEEVTRRHCLQRLDASRTRRFTNYTVGRTHLTDFTLWGKKLTLNIDVVVRPGFNGAPDSIYATPTLDLPEEWQRAIDYATYPALIVGGAVVLTTILTHLAK